jgi:hypothetical protein
VQQQRNREPPSPQDQRDHGQQHRQADQAHELEYPHRPAEEVR